MALVNCPNCGKEISDKAKICPNCENRIKKNNYIKYFVGCVIVVCIVISAFGGLKYYQKLQEEKRQEKIKEILVQVDELYSILEFDEVEKCYDELDVLGYNTNTLREVLEYDRIVYDDAYNYYVAINAFNDSLHTGGYNSIRGLLNELKKSTDPFEQLEINLDSEIGNYIRKVKNNVMYQMLNSEFVYSSKYNVDYGLTSFGYASILSTYSSEIVKEKFPY